MECIDGLLGRVGSASSWLLTVNEVAASFRVSPWTIYRKAAAGEIPSIRLGRTVRFELAAVLTALRCGAAPLVSAGEASPMATNAQPPRPPRRHRRKSVTTTSLASVPAAPVGPAERLRAAVAATARLRK